MSTVGLISLRRVHHPYRYLQILNGIHSSKGCFPVQCQEVSSRQCPGCRGLSDKARQVVTRGDKGGAEVSTDVMETVKETTKTASYGMVILAGLGVTGGLFYVIFSELFSSKSPNSVYSKALDKCCEDNRVKDTLGEPIKGHGEESGRRRRRFVR